MDSSRGRAFKVGLLSTAALDSPGSMRAYVAALQQALSRHAPQVELDLIELEPAAPRSRWRRASRMATLPVRARTQRRQVPDLWHVLDGSSAALASMLDSAPVVVTVHDIIPCLQAGGAFAGAPRPGLASRWWWRGNARVFRRARTLVCDSANTAHDLQRAFGIAPSKCPIVPLPLRPGIAELASVPVQSDRVRGTVLHVGNAGFYKNRAGVLRIFARCAPALATKLWMAGPAPDQTLLNLAAALGIADRVEWIPDPEDSSLAARLRSASVLLFPSLYEGYGWPVLEAMAFGLPVVASDAGSLAELVGDAAAVFKPLDEAGMAAAVEHLLGSEDAARAAAERGRARASEFDEARFAREMVAAYESAMTVNEVNRTT